MWFYDNNTKEEMFYAYLYFCGQFDSKKTNGLKTYDWA